MMLKAKVGIVTAVGALAVTGSAAAEGWDQGDHGQQGQGIAQQGVQSQGDQGQTRGDHGQFRGFGRRGRSFGRSVFGVLVSWTATQTGTNTYSGTITVTKPNFKAHWDRKGSSTQQTQSAPPTQVTYTFTNAKVFFGQGANPPAAGDLVKIIGARLNHCSTTTSSGTSTSTGSSTSTTNGSTGTSTTSGSGTATSNGNVRAIFIAAPRTAAKS